jgi:pyruvate,water dikinase
MLGAPQDIEWTIDTHGKLFVVQSRPISVSAGKVSPGPYVVWSNANINENFPEPVSPLLYSIAKEGYSNYFRNLGEAYGVARWRLLSMEHFFRNIIGIHGGRMYYNLSNIHSVLQLMPYGGLLAEFFNQFVGVVTHSPTDEPGRSPCVPEQSRLVALLEICRIGLQTLWQYMFFTKRVESFERTVTQFSERTVPAMLAQQTLLGLHQEFHDLLEIRFHRWTNAALADAASMVCYGLLKRVLSLAFPAANQAALHNTLLKGLLNLVSTVPAVRLWELAQVIKGNPELMRLFVEEKSEAILASLLEQQQFAFFKSQFDTFLHEWGFRFSGELMLTVPNFQERPTALLEILKKYVGVEGESPLANLERQNLDRNRETQRVLREAPWIKVAGIPVIPQAWLINRLLTWTQHAITLRERARMKQALLYSRARQIALAIGDKLVARGDLAHCDDVFFLTHQELDTLLSGSAMFPYWNKELVAARQSWFQVLQAMNVPDTFDLPEGEYLGHTNHMSALNATDTASNDLRGIGACGGRVTARATVLADLSEANRLSAGDVLVTKQTDPGWGLVFFLIKGLVMERGGMLSHGAIIAREYGIPTVVGVRDATRSIPHGSTVTVDGDQGLVRLVD